MSKMEVKRVKGKAVKRNVLITVIVLLVLLFLGILFVFPMYWTFITSFKLKSQIFVEKPILWPSVLYLDNYIEIFRKSFVGTFFLNSLKVAGTTTGGTILLATMCAFAICRYDFKISKLIKNFIITVRMIPALVYTIPYYIIFNKLGLLDSLAGLVLAYVTFSLPLAVWLSVNFFVDIPKEIYESAEIDGCGEMKMYSIIGLPLIRTGIVVIAILVFIGAWNEFGLALVLQSSDLKKTLPIGIASMIQTHKDTPSGSLAAAGMIAIIPGIILSLSTQKYFIKGMMTGAVKG